MVSANRVKLSSLITESRAQSGAPAPLLRLRPAPHRVPPKLQCCRPSPSSRPSALASGTDPHSFCRGQWCLRPDILGAHYVSVVPSPATRGGACAIRTRDDKSVTTSRQGDITCAAGKAVQDPSASDTRLRRPEQPEEESNELVLRIFSVSAAFMVLWTLLPFPGSVYVGGELHDRLVDTVFSELGFEALAPTSLLLKYNRLGHAPALLHALPGAVWCLLAPLQLRGAAAGPPGKHRATGRAMLVAAGVLMVGYALIDGGGLTADVVDFGGHGGGLADSLDALGISPLPFNGGGLKFVAGWFIYTGVQTWHSAAVRGDYQEHRAWAIRHCGAGLWVALQRPLFAGCRGVQVALGASGAADTIGQADAFYYCAYFTTLLYWGLAELVARQEVSK
ncbi:hypothetical protein CYMTET_23325 [Cymbomonas tetramitiformis]|uniref:Uncharacterized protein n=1 Tax=Cymbomonas tetramitiformis TaxID=36881 RepID=A0AAE0FYW6_9CHLO|nr:hypothetical protein CYMTET_23325 [Cymbomonas tetramitiformis]